MIRADCKRRVTRHLALQRHSISGPAYFPASSCSPGNQKMLDALRPEDLENVASNIHGSDLYALAEQIVFQVMSSPEEAGIWSQSLVALFDRITEPGAHDKGFAQPLGGSSGPGKAFRFALVQECMDVFEGIMAEVDYTCFLPHRHPDYVQANKNLSAFGHMLCAFVNWKVVRDTMLHRGLERLFSILPYQEDMSAASIEVAANILQAVEPWMEMNWGYTSWRYLDNYYHRMQQWCQRQIKTPAGRFVDVEFPYDILDNVVTPKVRWISEQRENRAAVFALPAVDVAACEALGRSRVPPLPMELTLTFAQPRSHQPVEPSIKTEQEYSGEDGPSYFAYPLLPVDDAPAAASDPWPSCSDDQEGFLDSAMLPVNISPANFPAAPAANTFDDISATAAAPAPPAAAATLPVAVDSCVEATAGVVPASCQTSIPAPTPPNATPANTATSSDSASSCSSESMFVPRSCASSGSSHSSSGAPTDSPDTSNNSTNAAEDAAHSSNNSTNAAEDAAYSSDNSTSAAEDAAHSSNNSTNAAEDAAYSSHQATSAVETPLHASSSNDKVSHRSPMPRHMKTTGPMGHSGRSSQAVPTREHVHKHEHTTVQRHVPMRNSSAQLDTMSSNHPTDAPTSDSLHSVGRHPEGDTGALKEAVSSALQEFMLSHDAADILEPLQVLLSSGNAAGVLQTLLQAASAKLEQLNKPKPFSDSTRLPRSRQALQRHFAEQRDRLFRKGGVIDPLAYDFNQHGPAKGRRSGLGLQIPPCNPGYKLMTRWGWEEGRGLGANLQGRTEPCLPAYQPLDPDNAKQGLGEQRYKGILPGPAAAVQLRELLVTVCSGENAVLGEEAVQEGLYAFLTNSAPCATPHAPPLRARALCWVGSLLGALVYKGTLVPELASDMVYAAAGASCGPGGSSTSQRLANNMWSAVGKQTGACRRAEEQMQEAKQKEERQLAELHQPRAPTKKTTYIQNAEGKALKIRIKQYGGTSSAAPSSDGRVSWE